jgi:hypothetical protein
MLRTFSVVIFISTIVGVVLKLFTYMPFTYMHFVIFVMFNLLYRRRLSCHLGEINAGFELFGHDHGYLETLAWAVTVDVYLNFLNTPRGGRSV